MSIDRTLQTLPSLSAEERRRLRDNAERLLKEGTPQRKADAARVLQALSELAGAEHQAIIDRLGPMTAAQRVVEAFRALPMTETESKVIQALLDHPGATSAELSRALGWGGMSWHMHFGTMCFDRAMFLWPAPHAEQRNRDFYSGILADLAEPANRWTMKPEVAAAFAAMGLVPAPPPAPGPRHADL